MSYAMVLGVTPNRRPIELLELRNAHGWAPGIWPRLLRHHGYSEHWLRTFSDHDSGPGLTWLWKSIEELPEWEQAPLVLTFDTGVIPWQAYEWAADQLDEFERRLPANPAYVNHVPTVAQFIRTKPEAPLIGVWGTSVTENPFDPWDEEKDDYVGGIPLLGSMYVLERHRHYLGVS